MQNEIRKIFESRTQRSEQGSSCSLDLSDVDQTIKNLVKGFLPEFMKEHPGEIYLKISNETAWIAPMATKKGFVFKSVQGETCELVYRPTFFERLRADTRKHAEYLASIGFSEKARKISVTRFRSGGGAEPVDLAPFDERTPVPREVLAFDPKAKNTLVTTDPETKGNKPEDLKKILDIRLYPPLKDLMEKNKVEAFLGTKEEMAAYYKAKNSEILFEFSTPSTAAYYVARSETGELTVVMAGLVSRENLVAQLLTLKLGNIAVENIEIIGGVDHFSRLARSDIKRLMNEFPDLKQKSLALIVAGCGLKEAANEVIRNEFNDRLGKPRAFQGNIVSLTYHPLLKPENEVDGFFSLDLNYGEIAGEIVSLLLENCHCGHVFSGGAGGYIPSEDDRARPPIGKRISVDRCMNEEGEIAYLNDPSGPAHLQIPSIFLETYEWLESAKKRGSSIDVETFHIVKAIQKYNREHGCQVHADCGIFVSDYVGKEPLRSYNGVYEGYSRALKGFVANTLNAKSSESKSYNPKPQTEEEIKITASENDPRVPYVPRMDAGFLSGLTLSEAQREEYVEKIMSLNPGCDEAALFENKKWNIDHYNRENLPVNLGTISDRQAFSQKRGGVGLRFLDLPIHMPGQGWRLPPELEQFKEFITMVVKDLKIKNPDFEKTNYVYITVDQGMVPPGEAQRRTGWHGDSYIKARENDKSCDTVYVCSDACPTPFVPGPVSFDGVNPENIDEVLTHFSEVGEEQEPVYYPNCTGLRVDPYCVHNVGFNNSDKEVFRTFVKVSVSESKYTKLGNCHNPLFIYDWPMRPRHGVPYDNRALAKSSHRKDRDKFAEVNPHIVDFSKQRCSVDWTGKEIKSAYRTASVRANPAKEGEVLPSVYDGFLITIHAAEKGYWKISPEHGDEYFLSDEKFNRLYKKDPERPGWYAPRRIERRVVELTQDVRFMAPWGQLQYARKGDYLMRAGKDDIYAIPKGFFETEFTIVEKSGPKDRLFPEEGGLSFREGACTSPDLRSW